MMRFYKGMTLEDIKNLTMKEFNMLLKGIGKISDMENPNTRNRNNVGSGNKLSPDEDVLATAAMIRPFLSKKKKGKK